MVAEGVKEKERVQSMVIHSKAPRKRGDVVRRTIVLVLEGAPPHFDFGDVIHGSISIPKCKSNRAHDRKFFRFLFHWYLYLSLG